MKRLVPAFFAVIYLQIGFCQDNSYGLDAGCDDYMNGVEVIANAADLGTYSRTENGDGSLAATDQLALALLCRHNTFRSAAGLSSLVWNTALASFAHNHLETIKGTCDLDHSTSASRSNIGGFSSLGENLYSSSGSTINSGQGLKAVNAWYGEIQYFQYNPIGIICDFRGSGNQQILHFTQVMWESTTAVGCDIVMCTTMNWKIVSCNYGEAGNVGISSNPPFQQTAADTLNTWEYNDQYNGLPNCNDDGSAIVSVSTTTTEGSSGISSGMHSISMIAFVFMSAIISAISN